MSITRSNWSHLELSVPRPVQSPRHLQVSLASGTSAHLRRTLGRKCHAGGLMRSDKATATAQSWRTAQCGPVPSKGVSQYARQYGERSKNDRLPRLLGPWSLNEEHLAESF